MTRPISLAHLTVLSLPPPEMIRVAASTGYDKVGLRLIAVTDTTPGYPLMRDPAMLRETRTALADTNIGVLDVEFIRITPDLDIAGLEPFLAVAAELGARHVVTAPYDPDLGRLADRLFRIADLAADHGLGVVLEFFPWTSVPDLATAASVVAAANRENVGILVDTLHFDRSRSALADLAAVPPARLPFLHLSDAPVQNAYTTDELLHAARAERLPPGEGGIALGPILAAMPADVPIALEVPMQSLTAAEGPEAVARRVRRVAVRFLDSVVAAAGIGKGDPQGSRR